MRKFLKYSVITTVAIIILCEAFRFSIYCVFDDYIRNVDTDGSRGRAIAAATARAREQESRIEQQFGEDFHIWSGPVVSIQDGDTVTVWSRGQGKDERIRLYGIDCPELSQPCGETAKKFVADRIANRRVDVVEIGERDKYGRIVGVIEVDGESVNESLIQAGYAWVYPQYCKGPVRNAWDALEADAKANHRGLWADGDAVEPWAWRKQGKDAEINIDPESLTE